MANLTERIHAMRRRVRLLLVERYGLIGGAAGAVVAAVMALLSLRYDALISYTLWAGALVFGTGVGVAWGLLRKLDDFTIALAVDRRAGLKERMSTALMVSDDTSWAEALVHDAREHVTAVSPKSVFPHKFGMPHWVFGGAALLLACAVVLPQVPALQSSGRRQEVTVMKRQGAKLKSIAKDIRKQTSPSHTEMRKLANRLENLGKKMQTGRMTRKQAMLKTRKLTKEVKEQQNLLARRNSPGKPMEQAQLEMRKAAEQLSQKMAMELAKKENIPLAQAMNQVPSDKRLAELARKDGPLTESERKELEQAVSKYANRNSSEPIPSELGEALAKLAQSQDYQKAAELMKKLSQRLNSGKMSKSDQESLRKQMQALAKSLKGTDLDKLAKAMRQNAEALSKMSDEQLKQLMKQIAEAQKMQKTLAKAGGG
ncbi:MAG: hypothetical protein ABFD54_10375 [Armatimonadota bacterium]|nr:hypothetical protein [bacterium]